MGQGKNQRTSGDFQTDHLRGVICNLAQEYN